MNNSQHKYWTELNLHIDYKVPSLNVMLQKASHWGHSREMKNDIARKLFNSLSRSKDSPRLVEPVLYIDERREPKITIRITSVRIRLLDPDNLAGGCKYLIDRLRESRLIPDDTPQFIILETRQVKAERNPKTKETPKEETIVKLTYPYTPDELFRKVSHEWKHKPKKNKEPTPTLDHPPES